jgi:hypothetical protein
LPIGLDGVRGVSPDRHVIADSAERAQPLPRPRTAPRNDHEPVRPAGDEDIQDLGKLEELMAYLLHDVAGT